MGTTALRNIGIVVLLALAVFLLPGGGDAAEVVIALIGVLFSVAIWFFLMRMYREHRTTLLAMPDQIRGIFYACGAGLLFAGASAGYWWDSGVGTLAWLVLVGAIIFGFVTVYRHHREYV